MNATPLRLGFIGGGFISRFHIQSLVEVRDCEVVGVVSKTHASATECAELAISLGVGPKARVYASIQEMAADDGVDALWICARNDTRLEVMN